MKLNLSAKTQILLLTLPFLVCCSPLTGGSDGISSHSNPESAITCPIPQEVLQSTQPVSHESVNLDPRYDSYIVEFKPIANQGLDPSGNPVHEYEVAGVTLKTINRDTFSFQMTGTESHKRQIIEKLAQHRAIEFVEPDYLLHFIDGVETEGDVEAAATMPWAHGNIQSTSAWQVTTGSSHIVVAVVDSGIDYTHIDLKDNMWTNPNEVINGIDDDHNGYIDDVRGWNYVDGNNNPITTSRSNHGTHVAGIIGATGAGGRVWGVARQVKLMPLKFIGDGGSGASSSAIRAIDYAISKKVFAINNSWGSNNRSQALENAIKRAEAAGILFVVAAGNGFNHVGYDVTQKAYYPAAYPESNVLRVAATTSSDNLTNFSNFGLSLIDVAAPGQNILSTVTGNRYMNMSGTSMATPLVTGLAVLVKAANPNLNPVQIKAIIGSTADPISSLKYKIRSGGRVNARQAVYTAAHIDPQSTCE